METTVRLYCRVLACEKLNIRPILGAQPPLPSPESHALALGVDRCYTRKVASVSSTLSGTTSSTASRLMQHRVRSHHSAHTCRSCVGLCRKHTERHAEATPRTAYSTVSSRSHGNDRTIPRTAEIFWVYSNSVKLFGFYIGGSRFC